ncbi:hypothetical protein E4U54_000226 [Claviceps lovelessii]|nr:hypothetical protein E4U54_000226 [Claviceps lovelessii]
MALPHKQGAMTDLRYIQYQHELESRYLPAIRSLISKDLSEPYSIYVYRYFLCQWAHLCYMVSRIRVQQTTCGFYKSEMGDVIFGCNDFNILLQALHPIDSSLVGVVVCKLEVHSSHSPPTRRGYIAMLAVESSFRGHGIATALVKQAIDAMIKRQADEIVLETEETNVPAMKLYERLGFLRSKKLHRYYLNGNSAYRLVLPLRTVDPEEGAKYSTRETFEY